jgi:hypothetical protein
VVLEGQDDRHPCCAAERQNFLLKRQTYEPLQDRCAQPARRVGWAARAFIWTAIRNQLTTQANSVKQPVTRSSLKVGLRRYDGAELLRVRSAGDTLRIKVPGLCIIDDDVSEELALAVDRIDYDSGRFADSPSVESSALRANSMTRLSLYPQ